MNPNAQVGIIDQHGEETTLPLFRALNIRGSQGEAGFPVLQFECYRCGTPFSVDTRTHLVSVIALTTEDQRAVCGNCPERAGAAPSLSSADEHALRAFMANHRIPNTLYELLAAVMGYGLYAGHPDGFVCPREQSDNLEARLCWAAGDFYDTVTGRWSRPNLRLVDLNNELPGPDTSWN